MHDRYTGEYRLLVHNEDLVSTDLVWEAFFLFLKQNPLVVFFLPWWLLRGREFTAVKILDRVDLDLEYLPYNKKLLEYLQAQHAIGRRLVLVTVLPLEYAGRIADYLGLFSRVLTREELPAYLESARQRRIEIRSVSDETAFDPQEKEGVFRKKVYAYLRAIRLHQWLKNILVFVPLVTAHRMNEPVLVGYAFLGFLSFSLCASGVYLLNDLLDLPVDRRHPRKCTRPFAAAAVSVQWGSVMIVILTLAAFGIGLVVSTDFLYVLTAYLLATVSYSFWLKKVAVIDVIVLAFLYTVRILAGGTSVAIVPSFWLLAFSLFVFFSLALIKRYAELLEVRSLQGFDAGGRGYRVTDMDVIRMFGISSGYMSVLVLALYINSEDVQILYSHPRMIWLLCPIFLYWISRMWLITGRGGMDDDPLLFTLQDHVSQGIFVVGLLVLWLAV